MAQAPLLSRRHLLQLASLGGTALAAGSLAGCRQGAEAGRLLTVRGQLPPAWLKALPTAWRSQLLEDLVLDRRQKRQASTAGQHHRRPQQQGPQP